jgi:2-polyprenyl-3-methyl-5-hydroxy-6-metoxy-1,4-benzoquinol methylase
MTSASSPAIAYHDQLASGWSGRYASGGFKRRAEFFVGQVLPRVAPRGDWIDVGCGSGVFSRMLAAGGAKVLGVDGSAAMIQAARETPVPPDSGPPPRYEVETVETLSRDGEAFDGALFLSVIEYLADPTAALDALARLLRPGGRLVLSAPNRHSGLRRAQTALRAVSSSVGSNAFAYLASSRNAWSRRELIALAAASGFTTEDVLGFDPVLTPAFSRLLSPSLWFLVCHKTA